MTVRPISRLVGREVSSVEMDIVSGGDKQYNDLGGNTRDQWPGGTTCGFTTSESGNPLGIDDSQWDYDDG